MIHLNDCCEHQLILFLIVGFIVWNFIMELSYVCFQFALTQLEIRKILKEGCKVINITEDHNIK